MVMIHAFHFKTITHQSQENGGKNPKTQEQKPLEFHWINADAKFGNIVTRQHFLQKSGTDQPLLNPFHLIR